MRILQVSTWDICGGAEKVAWQLMEGYAAAGHESWMAVGEKRSTNFRVLTVDEKGPGNSPSLTRRLGRLWRRELGHEEFEFPATRRLLDRCPQRPEILHCHNLHGPGLPGRGYFDLRCLPDWSAQMPVVLTLHDAWLLSGHCAHSFECERWITGCGACPHLDTHVALKRDGSAYNWRLKRDIYRKCKLYVSTPSRWLMEKVEKSILAPGMIQGRVIANGVDLAVFRPAEQRAARVKLNLPLDARILLFAANGIRTNQWKDYALLRTALAQLAEKLPDVPLLLIALGENSPPEQVGRAQIHFVPHQSDPESIALYYQASDVYANPSKADTFPTVILEALACGRPVVATAVGGIVDQVEEGVTGFLTPPGDAPALAARLAQLLTDEPLRQKMGDAGARHARQFFSLDQQIKTYLQWYEEILGVEPNRHPSHQPPKNVVRLKEQPSLGVLIPTRNCRAALAGHLDAIAQLQDRVAEIVVVDSNSTDGTMEMLRSRLRHPRLKLLTHPPGLYESWNFGIKHLTSTYTYIATVGDLISPAGLEHLLNVAEEFQSDLVLSAPVFKSESGEILMDKRWPIHNFLETRRISHPQLLPSSHLFWSSIIDGLAGMMGSSASNLYRTSVLQKHPFFTEFGHVGDTAWGVAHAFHVRAAITPQPCANFLIHPSVAELSLEEKVEAEARMLNLARNTLREGLARGIIPVEGAALVDAVDKYKTHQKHLTLTADEYHKFREQLFPWFLNPMAWRVRSARNHHRAIVEEMRHEGLNKFTF